MDKKLLLGIASILVVIVGSVVYLLTTNKNSHVAPIAENKTVSESTGAPNSPEPHPGVYVDYSPSVVQSAQGTKLLFFYAPWCPQCRQLDADIKKSGVPNDVTIFKVDYDSRQDLRMQYGVTIQTTVVKINDDGSLVKKYVAYDQPALSTVLKNLLP